MLLPVKSAKYFDGKDILIEPIVGFQFRPAATANSISSCRDKKTICRIGNFKGHSIILRKE